MKKTKSQKAIIAIISILLALVLLALIAIAFIKSNNNSITLTINESDFETQSNITSLSGTVSSNEEINSVSYKLYEETESNDNMFRGKAEIDGEKWTISKLFIKPGNNKVIITATTESDSIEKTINIYYDIGKPYELNNENVKYDDSTQTHYVNNIIIILFNDNVSQERKQYIVKKIDGEIVGRVGDDIYDVQISERTLNELEDICKELEQFEEVFFAHVDYAMHLTTNTDIRNSSLAYKYWEKTGNWGFKAIDVPSAWKYKERFSHINIGVVDDGFDLKHEDLKKVFIPSVEWMKSINDYKYWDDEQEKEIKSSHGTHVAGIIGANNDKKGITGILDDVNIFYTDWRPNETKDKQNWDTSSQVISSLKYSVEAGAKVVNYSLGISNTIDYKTFIETFEKNPLLIDKMPSWKESQARIVSKSMTRLLNKGYDFIVVQSAGNGVKVEVSPNKKETIAVDATNNGYWTSVTKDNVFGSTEQEKQNILNRIIIVGAVKRNNDGNYQQCVFSNGGDRVDICAPGEDIYSTVINDKYDNMSGTSMAAPMVTAVCGMVWSVNPNFTGAEVKDIVCNNTSITVFDNPDGKHPLVNEYKMVNAKLSVEEAIRRTDNKGTVSAVVKDKETNKALTNVSVIFKSKTGNTTKTIKTDKNGNFKITLPIGDYNISLSSEKHTSTEKCMAVKVEKDVDRVLQTPLYMTRKTGTLKATIKDKTNNKPIPNVKVEVNDGNATVATVKTDKNGVFSVELPYGNYSLYFIHDNYELDNDNKKDITVSHENNSLAEAILLTPITKIIDLSKYIGTDIVEFASLFRLEKVESDMPIEYGNKYVSVIGSKSKKIISISINSTMFDGRYDECDYSIYGIKCGMSIKNAEEILNREFSTVIPASEEYSYYYFEVDGGVSLSLYASGKIHIITLTDDIESELDVPQENQIKNLNFQINKENVKSFLTGVLSLITEYNVKLGSVSVSHDVDLYEFMRAEIEIQTTGLEEDTFYIDFYPKRKSGSNKLYYIEISSGYCDDKNDSDYVGYKVIVDALEEYLSGEALYGKKEQEIESLSNGKKGVSYYLEDNKYECSIVQINTSMGKTLYYYYIYANETSNNSTVSNQQKDYNIESYEELVDLCFEAINNDDISIIEPYIYDDYGNEWNKNHIYDIIGEFHGRYRDEEYYDEDEIKPKDCLPLAPNIESVNKQSKSEFEEAINWKLDNWFYNSDDYQKRVCEIQLEVVEERLIIDLDTEYPQGIILDKIDGRWYIDSIDLD